jgi:hypothetical protein
MYSLIRFKNDKKSRIHVVLTKWISKVEKEEFCVWPGAQNLRKFVKNNIDSSADWISERVEIKGISYGKINILFKFSK